MLFYPSEGSQPTPHAGIALRLGSRRLAYGLIMLAIGLSASSMAFAQGALSGTIASQRAQQLIVEGKGVGRWVPGMAVWVSEVADDGRPGLALAAGTVTSVHAQRAVVTLSEPVQLPKGALVEPRFVAEARQYGRGVRDHTAPAGAAERAKRSGPPFQTWHKAPGDVEWGESLWLEVVATPEVSGVTVRHRAGTTGPFATLPMTSGKDGLWTARMPVGNTPPDIREMQYYVVATIQVPGEKAEQRVIVAHPATPNRVRIQSAPRRPSGQKVDHDPAARWSHKKDLEITAEVDKRYRNPVVHYRQRGGGVYVALAMKQINDQTWRAVIPGQKVVVPGLSYYISVTDEKGVVRDGFRNKRAPYDVHVTRGRILSESERRNVLGLEVDWVGWGGDDDSYMRYDVSFDRLFFGFLVARLGGTMLSGRSQAAVGTEKVDPDKPNETPATVFAGRDMNLLGGHAGAELRLGDYFSWHADLRMGIHNDGAALGYETGVRIGDEMGANLTGRYGTLWDLDSGDPVAEQLRLSLSAPVGSSWRLAGVLLHESVLQDASKGLRLQIEATWMMHERVYILGRGGFAGRDADNPGYTGGGGMRLVF